MLANMVNSGIAIPAPLIINAITAPTLAPFSNNASPMGIADSTRIYKGMPINATATTASGLSRPATLARRSSGSYP